MRALNDEVRAEMLRARLTYTLLLERGLKVGSSATEFNGYRVDEGFAVSTTKWHIPGGKDSHLFGWVYQQRGIWSAVNWDEVNATDGFVKYSDVVERNFNFYSLEHAVMSLSRVRTFAESVGVQP